MKILRTTYNDYVRELPKANARIKKDKQIVKIILGMIKNKKLSPSQKEKLDELLN